MSLAAANSLFKVVEIQGRGRGLVASCPIRAGQVVLKDSPILLYSALPLIPQSSLSSSSTSASCFCDHCFRILLPSSSTVSCPSCQHCRFCSPNCLLNALNSSHSSWVCQALSHLRVNPVLLEQPLERQLQARFLIAAYNLAQVSPSDFQILLSVQGSPDAATAEAAQFLYPLFSPLCPPPINPKNGFSVELIAALLAKDKLNAFGLMQPFFEDDEQRSVRAYGIYPHASLFNHDCLPNACRFDYVDTSAPGDNHNTDIIIRMIHDVPEGREICVSYFPVNENYSSRQNRLSEDYGFTCSCDRCNVEAHWSDNENVEDDAEDEEDEAMDEDQYEILAVSDAENIPPEENSDFPHAYFFLRYMCDRKNCWGTLAPLPPNGDTPSTVMECNVCGNLKNDDGFGAIEGQDGVSMED